MKGYKTPMPMNGKLDGDVHGKDYDQKAYHLMIGSLLYLCASRPDIMLSVCTCARFTSCTERIESVSGQAESEILGSHPHLRFMVS